MNLTDPDPKLVDLVQKLVACEAARSDAAESNEVTVFHVSEKLRHTLSTIIGVAGYRALVMRALAVTRTCVPQVGPVEVKHDGSLAGLTDAGDPNRVSEAGALLIAEILALLVAFVGENMMLTLVKNAWPEYESGYKESSRNGHDVKK